MSRCISSRALVELRKLSLEAVERLLVETLLIPLALQQRLGDASQHLRLQAESPEQVRELALDDQRPFLVPPTMEQPQWPHWMRPLKANW